MLEQILRGTLPQASDKECEKCGRKQVVGPFYCVGYHGNWFVRHIWGGLLDRDAPEHFHYKCLGCQYSWQAPVERVADIPASSEDDEGIIIG